MFEDAIDRYPACRGLVYQLRCLTEQPGTTVEAALETFRDEAETYPRRRAQLAAIRFYLRDIIGVCDSIWGKAANGLTNYLALTDSVRLWQATSAEPVVLVTFNYDTLLEAAWTNETGMSISSMESYITQPSSAIIKVHGSVDWGHRVATNEQLVGSAVSIEQAIIENIDRLPVVDDFHLLQGAALIQTNTDYSLPAIAVPLRRKTAFECPKDHLAFLIDSLPKVKRLLVLGWAGGDMHFLQLCKEQAPRPERTLIVSGSAEGARQTNVELNRFGLSQNVVLSEGGFSDLVSTNRHELNQFLG